MELNHSPAPPNYKIVVESGPSIFELQAPPTLKVQELDIVRNPVLTNNKNLGAGD